VEIFITFDYELFFGQNSGSVQNSIIKPTQKLLEIANRYKVKFIFFVDSGYILKLKEYKESYKELQKDYISIINQIKLLDVLGHSIQLHIHPHWEDSYYDGKKWVINTTRYRLHDFNEKDIDNIVFRYKKALTDIVGDKVFAFRAGGWSIQPFSKIKDALKKNNIWLDSTLFYGGKNISSTHYFDFTDAPKKSSWNFENTPLKEVEDGYFTEIPIGSIKVNPLFYWKFAFTKKFASKKFKIYGDGSPIGASKKDILKMLFFPTYSPISADGYKSSLLIKGYMTYFRKNSQKLVIIGHPKAQNDYSLEKLEEFIKIYKKEITLF